ncbi:MAG: thioredoxin domain-containing protein [Rhodospirillales bacterium]
MSTSGPPGGHCPGSLTPLLERLVRQAGGKVRLVKIDIDKNQDLAAQLRIQSVPTVYAFVGGRPADAFVGAQPESKIRSFIDRLTRGGDARRSTRRWSWRRNRRPLATAPPPPSSTVKSCSGTPRHPKGAGEDDHARLGAGDRRARPRQGPARRSRLQVPRSPPRRLRRRPRRAEPQRLGDAAELHRRVQANPADHQARFVYPVALFAQGWPRAPSTS